MFRFGNGNFRCIGKLTLRMPDSTCMVVVFEAHVVPINVPLLLELDVLQKLKLFINFDDETLCGPGEIWSVKLVQKFGNMYIEWPPAVYHNEPELRRIHQPFYHPATEKLMNFIRKGSSKHATPQLRKNLDRVQTTCDTCQRLAKELSRFRVVVPDEDCVFNRTVGKDLMKISMFTVLQVVDKDKKFSAATILSGERREKFWEAFLCCWVAPYTGYPDNVFWTRGRNFNHLSFAAF